MFRTTTYYSNSVFGKNNNTIIANSDAADKIIIDMYAKLAKIVETINELLLEYSKGNFYAVANILTQQAYNKLAVSLANLAVSSTKYQSYEILRKSNTAALSGLYQSIIQYSSYVDIQTQLEICKEHDSILYDRVKLQDWINKLNQNKRVFPDSRVQVKKATLKPEYAEYIKMYGFPEGAIFEPDKLAFVLQKLGMQ
jgi:hypothetical protein